MARQFSGRRLRDERTAAGLTPEHLAIRIDRSVFAVHSYERGAANPSVAVLARLADVLDCPTDALFEQTAVAS
ncbi:helix-turn-helix domain-containing protein [Amycolatopsis sp. NPDC003861]